MSALFENIPENIEKVTHNDYSYAMKEYKYLRPGNVKYTNTKLNFNEDYFRISAQMDLSTTFDMLIKSKRINIYILCQAAIDSIQNQNSLMLVVSLRSLVERLAYYNYFVRQTKNHPISSETSLEELQGELLPKVLRGLYQTSSEIRDFDRNVDIKNIDIKPYEMRTNDSHDRKPLNILTPIKQLDKTIKGIWNSYILLSEYLHPNFGDLELASKSMKIIKNEFGDPQIFRSLGRVSPTDGISQSILTQTTTIIDEACGYYLETTDAMETYSVNLKMLSRSAVHELLAENKALLKNTAGFRKGTKCPCLSGKRIMDCRN
jgi:hypothetical protein|tara:strand:+ start:1529 stop:2485 length:957 start_codon:yes stop_codon:yes gene_type:complete